SRCSGSAEMRFVGQALRLPNQKYGLVQPVYFYEGIAGRVLKAAHDRRVAPRRQRSRNGGFQIVRWRQAGAGDNAFLGVSPIIVRDKQNTVPIVERQRRIGQRVV